MKYKVLALAAGAAVILTVVLGGERYLAKNTTKIDETVQLVTLDEFVIVMQKGERPQVTRVRPPVVPPKDIRPPAQKGQPAPAAIKWTLPFSCSDARYYASHFSQSQLEAMRKAAGMAMPSAAQQAQIRACIAGRVK